MKLRELIEAKAREAVYTYDNSAVLSMSQCVSAAIIATLNECGFREALGWQSSIPGMPRVTAEAKLKELEEMSK